MMLFRSIVQCLLLCFLANLHSTCFEEKTALAAAKVQHRPIVAAFLGEECPWSNKLKADVLTNPTFLRKMNEGAILWISTLKQNEKQSVLLQKYRIAQCPFFLLLDPQGKEFARLEYSSLDAKGYASTLLGLIEDFQDICDALDQEGTEFDEQRWQELYHKAKRLSVSCFQQVILEEGVEKEEGHFFHLEKFATLLGKHKTKHPLVRKAKRQLLSRDPQNQYGLPFKAAAIEFEQFRSKDSVERALRPLARYIQRFGKKDLENYWKAEWMVAEFLFSRGWTVQALEHAEIAYHASPSSVRPQLAETMNLIRLSAKK